jgi:hypothetical protein
MTRAGWILTAVFTLFMLGASVAPKFAGAAAAVDALTAIGWSPRFLPFIGTLELAFVILFLVPRTALIGAVLMTGLLGGAMASHLRADSPLFSHTLFGLYLGVLMWAALWLRDPRLRAYLAPGAAR